MVAATGSLTIARAAKSWSNRCIPLIDIKGEIDKLYQLPLAGFVDARNQLASKLRRMDRAASQTIKKLAKPSVSAWAVNQAYWQSKAEFEALLDAGDKLRALQKRALEGDECGGDIQAAMLAQRTALLVVKKSAEQALDTDGHGTSNQILRRVSTTLEALATYGRDPDAPTPGRLSADVPAPGFDALAALAGGDAAAASRAQSGGRSSANDNRSTAGASPAAAASTTAKTSAARRTAQVARERARAEARATVDQANEDVGLRRRAVVEAKATEKAALDRVYACEKAIEIARQELERANATLEAALREAEAAKVATHEAHAELGKAEVVRQEAEQRLAELS